MIFFVSNSKFLNFCSFIWNSNFLLFFFGISYVLQQTGLFIGRIVAPIIDKCNSMKPTAGYTKLLRHACYPLILLYFYFFELDRSKKAKKAYPTSRRLEARGDCT